MTMIGVVFFGAIANSVELSTSKKTEDVAEVVTPVPAEPGFSPATTVEYNVTPLEEPKLKGRPDLWTTRLFAPKKQPKPARELVEEAAGTTPAAVDGGTQ